VPGGGVAIRASGRGGPAVPGRRLAGALIATVAVALVATAGPASAQTATPGTSPVSAQTATSDTSPVNLSNNINMANGTAASAATVVSGDARFEVLAPEVIRMEYSPTGSFLNSPTFDIMDRDFAVPAYTSSVSGGVLTITTSAMTLTYKVGSGPFSTVNTKLQLLGALPPGASASVTPTWGLECTFGQVCHGLPQPGRVRGGAERDRGGRVLAGARRDGRRR
jgi:hypothetical protein